MEPTPLGFRDVGVDRITDQTMAEPIPPRSMGRQEDEVVGQLRQGPGEVLRRLASHAGEKLEVERPADDGSRACDRGRGIRPAGKPGEDRVLDGLGHIGVADFVGQQDRRPRQDRQQFFDMEGDAVGPLVDGRGDITRQRQAGADEQRRHRRRVRRGQSVQADFLGLPSSEQAGAPLPHRGSREKLVAAVCPDHQQAPFRNASGQRLEDLERQIVAPVQVLQREDGRTVGGQVVQDLGDVEHEHAASSPWIAAGSLLPCVRVLQASAESESDLGQRRLSLHGARDVDEDRGRDLDIARVRAAADHTETGGLRTPLHRAQEPGLADPGFTGKQEEAPRAGQDLGDAPIGQRQEVVAADEHRTDERASVVHAESVGDGRAASSVT